MIILRFTLCINDHDHMMENYMKSTLTKVAVAATFLAASGAHAFTITGDVGVARSIKKFEFQEKGKDNVGLKSLDYSLSAHVQPMDEIPLSLGLRANLITLGHKDAKNLDEKIVSRAQGSTSIDSVNTAYGFEFTPEMRVWAPAELLGSVGDVVSPYFKAGFSLEGLGNYKFEKKDNLGNKVKTTAKSQGVYAGIGAAVIVTDNISVLADYTYSNSSFRFKEDGKKGDKNTMQSHSFMLGARVSV